eukprot:3406449-Alexandrium_andersonii.AAC.1
MVLFSQLVVLLVARSARANDKRAPACTLLARARAPMRACRTMSWRSVSSRSCWTTAGWATVSSSIQSLGSSRQQRGMGRRGIESAR